MGGLQVLHEPCYDTLRTKQQLGYSVHSGVRLTHGILGFAVCVVSGMVQAPWKLPACIQTCTVTLTLCPLRAASPATVVDFDPSS